MDKETGRANPIPFPSFFSAKSLEYKLKSTDPKAVEESKQQLRLLNEYKEYLSKRKDERKNL